MAFERLFELRGELTKRDRLVLTVVGALVVLLLWFLLAEVLAEYVVTQDDSVDESALTMDQRLNLKAPLVALIDDLNALTETLNALYENTTAELKDRTSRQQALSAYGSRPDKAPSGGSSK